MSAPPDELAFDLKIALDAAKRWQKRKSRREQNKKNAEQGKWTAVEDKERLAKVANRRIRQLKQVSPAAELPQPIMDLVQHGEVRAEDVDNDFMERVIGATAISSASAFLSAGPRPAAPCAGSSPACRTARGPLARDSW